MNVFFEQVFATFLFFLSFSFSLPLVFQFSLSFFPFHPFSRSFISNFCTDNFLNLLNVFCQLLYSSLSFSLFPFHSFLSPSSPGLGEIPQKRETYHVELSTWSVLSRFCHSYLSALSLPPEDSLSHRRVERVRSSWPIFSVRFYSSRSENATILLLSL